MCKRAGRGANEDGSAKHGSFGSGHDLTSVEVAVQFSIADDGCHRRLYRAYARRSENVTPRFEISELVQQPDKHRSRLRCPEVLAIDDLLREAGVDGCLPDRKPDIPGFVQFGLFGLSWGLTSKRKL
jgi:hypothetical protein